MFRKNVVIGIHPWHDASVAFISEGKIIFTIAEERLSRIKHHYGFPILGLKKGMEILNLTPRQVAAISISTKKPILPHPIQYRVMIDGSCEQIRSEQIRDRFLNFKQRTVPIGKFKIPKDWLGSFEDRHWSHHYSDLVDLGLMDKRIPIYNIEHHKSHSSSAFRTRDWDSNVCVLSFDGKGDNLSHSTLLGYADGNTELFRVSSSKNSLGAFYQAVTESLGFVPVDGEYKTMGLAALGKLNATNPFSNIMSVENGELKSTLEWEYRPYNINNPNKPVNNPLSSVAQTDVFKKHLDFMSQEDFAYAAQIVFEETALELVKQSLNLTKTKKLALAGGCALNVKANMRMVEELDLDEFFVFPDSGDSGNSIGAALETYFQIYGKTSENLENMYLGTSYSNEQIRKILDTNKISYKFFESDIYEEITKILTSGKVIGVFWNSMEFGPRALGNRSVLADPRHSKIKDRINEILKGREWFVPFAPIVLKEDRDLYFNSEIELKHMTIAVKANTYASTMTPNVVHYDGSMRPQEVSKESNENLYKLLKEFKKVTGLGVLMNTSFNRHGLPIVESPQNALEHLRNGWIDVLILGNFIIE